jgi:ABC-type spermidine/putrescine transport system permease subunit II
MSWLLLKNSLLVAVGTVVLSVSVGFIAALWLAGLPARWRTGFFGAAIMALALPPFLVTNCWLHFLGNTGVWHKWLPLNIFSLGGTVWILSLLLWPLSLLLVWGAWQRLEASQLESDMMVTGWALLRALLFPLARSALVQAALLTFVLALNNFSVPAILQVKVFPAEIWIRFNTTFDSLGALQLSWPLVIGPLVLVLWLFRRELPWPHLGAPVPGRLFRQQLGPAWFWSAGVCSIFLCVCAVGLPLYQILSVARTWTELPGALAVRGGGRDGGDRVEPSDNRLPACRNPKPETRRPKAGRRPKSERQGPSVCPQSQLARPRTLANDGSWPIRISDFGFLSAFGLRPSDFLRRRLACFPIARRVVRHRFDIRFQSRLVRSVLSERRDCDVGVCDSVSGDRLVCDCPGDAWRRC